MTMLYEETLARSIISKHGLSPSVLKTWKHRGAIPSRYQDEHYDNSGPAALKDTIRMVEITQLPELCTAAFTSVKYRKVVDVTKYHRKGVRASKNFTAAEVIAFKSEVARLRNLLRAFSTSGNEKALKAIIADARIKHYVLFSGHKRMLSRLYRMLEAYDYEIEECLLAVARLHNLLKW